jgi:hypothetical protein
MKRTWAVCVLSLVLAGVLLPSPGFPASITHTYDLNGSLTDGLGGPSLISAGGTLTATGYTFGPNQGLTLSGGLVDDADYSLELVFNLETVIGDRRLLDFKNLTKDTGLYVSNGALNFFISGFDGGTQVFLGSSASIAAGQTVHLVFTRDDTTNAVVGYLNGVPDLSITDTGDRTVFTNSVIHFFIDDTVEAAGGFVDLIRVYDGALTAAEVAALYNGGTPVPSMPLALERGTFVLDARANRDRATLQGWFSAPPNGIDPSTDGIAIELRGPAGTMLALTIGGGGGWHTGKGPQWTFRDASDGSAGGSAAREAVRIAFDRGKGVFRFSIAVTGFDVENVAEGEGVMSLRIGATEFKGSQDWRLTARGLLLVTP